MNYSKKASLLLPNLRYNKYNKKIYFKTCRGVSLIENNKKKMENLFEMGDLSLNGKLTLFDIHVKCTIQEIEHYDGLIINIEYSSNLILYDNQLIKIAKYIEGLMCKLDTSKIEEIKDRNTFYDKQTITDSDSSSEHSFFHNNSEEPDDNYDIHDNQDNHDEEYYDDEDYDDPVY